MSEESQTVTVCDRVFQKVSIDEKIYLAPVAGDEIEEERLRSQHEIVLNMFGDRLFSPQVPVQDPRSILDCGYGGGDWAVQCAEEFEDCTVCI
jgi:hypothetical protein